MNQMPGHFPSSKTDFMKLVEGTDNAEILLDEAKLEKVVIDAMKVSDDPMVREIGEGLATGTMSWRTIATTSAYSDFVDQGLAALQQFDFNGLAADLEAAKAEPDQQKVDDRGRHDDDGENLWQGLRRKRR